MNLLILAAGKNSRLDQGIPKSLLELHSESLLSRHIRLFYKFGVRNIGIVTGYRSEMIERHLSKLLLPLDLKITIIFNSRFDLENGYSLYSASEWIKTLGDEAFFLTMADHVFNEVFLSLFTSGKPERAILLACDRPALHNRHIDIEDVTKVKLDSLNRIEQIGKTLSEFDVYDTGLFLMKQKVLEYMKSCFTRGEYSLSAIVYESARSGQSQALIIEPDCLWKDVDTPFDLKGAVELFD